MRGRESERAEFSLSLGGHFSVTLDGVKIPVTLRLTAERGRRRRRRRRRCQTLNEVAGVTCTPAVRQLCGNSTSKAGVGGGYSPRGDANGLPSFAGHPPPRKHGAEVVCVCVGGVGCERVAVAVAAVETQRGPKQRKKRG